MIQRPTITYKINGVDEMVNTNDKEYVVCMQHKIKTVIIPCGHSVIMFKLCKNLSEKLIKNCPLCRNKYKGIYETFN